jgi:hypothetical protein
VQADALAEIKPPLFHQMFIHPPTTLNRPLLPDLARPLVKAKRLNSHRRIPIRQQRIDIHDNIFGNLNYMVVFLIIKDIAEYSQGDEVWHS